MIQGRPTGRRGEVLGTPIDALTTAEVLELADRAVRERRRLLIGVVNAAKLVNMRRDAALREAVRSADLILADGMSVVWAGRLLGCPVPERVAGIDLMIELLKRGDEQRYRVYFLGATREVVEETVARVRRQHPNLELAGFRDGYFSVDAEEQVAAEIRAARPDLLFVAMSSPKKEIFLSRWCGHLDVPVCHGVGGAFDVIAGRVRRAPPGWQRRGLEWLYRLLQEPRRMWRRYLVTNTLFVGLVASALARRWMVRDRPA